MGNANSGRRPKPHALKVLRGITRKDRLNPNQPQPPSGEVVKPEFEDEYIEMLVSFFHYARYTEHLQFGLISPMNEPDLKKEGPTAGPGQYVVLLKKLMTRMKADGMGDVLYVAPDVASMNNGIEQYLPVLMKDTAIMQGIAHLGLHSYGGYYAHVDSFIRTTAYPEKSWWVTEWNSWRDGLDDGKIGVYDYKFASECVYKLLKILQHGASAGVAWEGYDSYYEHHAPSLFSYWGILGYNAGNKTYFPRKHFYAISQLSKFVRPGTRGRQRGPALPLCLPSRPIGHGGSRRLTKGQATTAATTGTWESPLTTKVRAASQTCPYSQREVGSDPRR